MSDETKQCPYCGETININAKKCRFCGEWLNEETPEEPKTINCPYCGEEILSTDKKCKFCGELFQQNIDPIEKADVNVKWKERFKAVDFFVLDGRWWKYKPDFWKSSIGERWKMSSKLYFSDLGSFVSVSLFGSLYYLFKGMWLKCIIYLILVILTNGILWVLYPCLAPYDYYRYKVLGKQW